MAERQQGEAAALAAATLPPAVARMCVALSGLLDLPFTGIDLRMTPEGVPVCFEANPCPAYSYYESHTGAPIARALVRWLAGGGRLTLGCPTIACGGLFQAGGGAPGRTKNPKRRRIEDLVEPQGKTSNRGEGKLRRSLVEPRGIEPLTSAMPLQRSPS